MKEDDKISFTAHLEELRKRLIICFIAVGVGFALTYGFKEKIFEILTLPLIHEMKSGDKMIFTGLSEAFFIYMKLSFFAGIALASPVVFYQIWRFVAPGLYHNEKRNIFPMVLFSVFFFSGGVLFCYFVVFPVAIKFFLGFASDIIQPLPSMNEYLSFTTKMLLGFGLVFQLPIVIIFLVKLGIVTVPFLRKNRKYAILLIFIVAAILTSTPDIFNQLLMAVPLMFLYEISIISAVFFQKKKEEKNTENKEKTEEG
ncbi:twin-arginine translocase subunit TatC [Desulfobacterium sp. N47]|uniref:twin-arginine translocase subunit TatC n=1 Tax=Desulfobacterium sp. N47 TaxID=3115210 RepID=UPI003F4A5B90